MALEPINSEKFNKYLAEALKQIPEFQSPEWVDFVKTSAHKMRPTIEPDFWHKRSASILRQMSLKKIVGVNRLRTRYGGNKNRGTQPSRFVKSGGKIIRLILQQAESAGLIEKTQKPKAGRKLTERGVQLLESIGAK